MSDFLKQGGGGGRSSIPRPTNWWVRRSELPSPPPSPLRYHPTPSFPFLPLSPSPPFRRRGGGACTFKRGKELPGFFCRANQRAAPSPPTASPPTTCSLHAFSFPPSFPGVITTPAMGPSFPSPPSPTSSSIIARCQTEERMGGRRPLAPFLISPLSLTFSCLGPFLPPGPLPPSPFTPAARCLTNISHTLGLPRMPPLPPFSSSGFPTKVHKLDMFLRWGSAGAKATRRSDACAGTR